MLTANNFEFRVRNQIDNTACDLQTYPFINIGYTLDKFATREDATAALESGVMQAALTDAGFTEADTETLTNPVYTQPDTTCEGIEATRAITHWQRGRYVVTAEITVPDDSEATPDQWLSEVVGLRLYEPVLASVLRSELR
jgi:hypothetical protein